VDRLKWAISRRKKWQSFFIFRCFDIARATTIKGALGDIQKKYKLHTNTPAGWRDGSFYRLKYHKYRLETAYNYHATRKLYSLCKYRRNSYL